ncbi:hypothetical protein [Planomicrobium okeanokoites]|uniref:hypothetical protein n=1 Tax=Planomicrobium okeanokoites TaxID=244 RepID=UPI0011834DF7|nr:hypothetical protein [Planomicrobium okeanokoites]
MKNVRCKAAKWLVGNKTIEVGNKRSRVGNKSMKVGSKQVEIGSKNKSLENEAAKVSISLSRRLILPINIDSLAAINQLGINQSELGINGPKSGIKHKKLGINKPELGINQNRPETPNPTPSRTNQKEAPPGKPDGATKPVLFLFNVQPAVQEFTAVFAMLFHKKLRKLLSVDVI